MRAHYGELRRTCATLAVISSWRRSKEIRVIATSVDDGSSVQGSTGLHTYETFGAAACYRATRYEEAPSVNGSIAPTCIHSDRRAK
jgi:hypothetical protein